MARTRGKKNFMMAAPKEVNYEDTEEGKSGGGLFVPHLSQQVMDKKLKLQGDGKIDFNVVPFEINHRNGVAVPLREDGKNYKKGDMIKQDLSGQLTPGGGAWGYVLNYAIHEIVTNHEEWMSSGDDQKKKTVKVVCPKTYGQRCPICEKFEEVRWDWPKKGKCPENSAYNKYVLNPLRQKFRSLFQIDVINGEDFEENDLAGKRRFWDLAHFYYKDLVEEATDEGVAYYDDSEDGNVVSVRYSNEGKSQGVPKYRWKFLDRDEELTDEALDTAIDLSDVEAVFNIRSYDEIMELLEPKVERKGEEEEKPTDKDKEEPPFDPDAEVDEQEEEEEKPAPRSRTNRRSRKGEKEEVPEVIQKVLDCPDGEALDDMCSELDIDIYFEDYEDIKSEDEQVSKCKEDMIEFIKKNIL